MASRTALGLLVLGLVAGCSTVTDEASSTHESDLSMQDLPVNIADYASGVFEQKLDHDDPASPTFQQRYWYSTQFASGPDAPVIFVIGGEGEMSHWSVLQRGDIAKVHGAAVVALEHRYYGKSLPFADPKVEDMKHLTIKNALADLSAFEDFAKDKLGLRGKWIATGVSYPGMLAAFYREKYPQQVVGAWASSAPVDMQLFWSGGDEVSARALGPDCLKAHQRVIKAVEDGFDDATTRADLAKRLSLTDVPRGANEATLLSFKRNWLGRISVAPRSAAQSDRVKNYCSALLQRPDPVDGFGGYLKAPLFGDEQEAALNPSHDATLPAEEVTEGGEARAEKGVGTHFMTMWSYQTCREMGFFEVASPNRELSVYSSMQDGASKLADCEAKWGVQPNLDATRAEYFDAIQAGQVSNLFFANGSLDPWMALSYTDQATAPAGVTVSVVALGVHGQDSSNLYPSSLLGTFDAHKTFNELATTWLAQ